MTTRLPAAEIEELKVLLEKAITVTPGADLPWSRLYRDGTEVVNGRGGLMLRISWAPVGDLIIAAVNALPAILSEIEAGRADAGRVKELEEEITSLERDLYAARDDNHRLSREIAALRQSAAQPAPGFADGIREAAAVADRFAAQAGDEFEAAAARDIGAGIRSLTPCAAQPAAEPSPAAVHLRYAMDLLESAAEIIDGLPEAHDADPNSDPWVWRHQYAIFLDPASAHPSFTTHGKPEDHAASPAGDGAEGGR